MFSSREQAGRLLAEKMAERSITANIVLGIPRGGVIVAYEIAQIMKLPLDVLVVKKLGAPQNPELAVGAITHDDITFIDEILARSVGADKTFIQNEVKKKHHELVDRERFLRGSKKPPEVRGKKIIVVDDGAATGATVYAAINWLRKKLAKKIILALPVSAQETAGKLKQLVDQCVILEEPLGFGAVGEYYQDFQEVGEEEVRRLLRL